MRKNKEERVARLEWAPNGGLGRAQIGKVRNSFYYVAARLTTSNRTPSLCTTSSNQILAHMSVTQALDIVFSYSRRLQGARVFSAPDGLLYRWLPSTSSRDILVSVLHFLLPLPFHAHSSAIASGCQRTRRRVLSPDTPNKIPDWRRPWRTSLLQERWRLHNSTRHSPILLLDHPTDCRHRFSNRCILPSWIVSP